VPYRDDLEARKARCAALERERDELRDRVRALYAARVELVTKEREVADARRLIDDPRSKRPLPLLDSLRVASPCEVSWEGMRGDARVRFCAPCSKNVYNLSAMPREEAEALVQNADGSLCVRMYRRADGTVIHADCPVGLRRKRVRKVALVAGGALTSAALLLASTAEVHQGAVIHTAAIRAREVRQAAEVWRSEHIGECPTVATLSADARDPSRERVLGPVNPADQWGTPFKIICDEDETTVVSAGRDQIWQTVDDIQVPEVVAKGK
jgi:hypothetical protein